jgi:ketosteroid isomerase-like protein
MSSDEEAVRRVLVEYCRYLDAGELDKWSELYEHDAVFAVPAANREIGGRDAIRRWMADTYDWANRGRHLTSNVIVTVDGNRATVDSDIVFFLATDDGPRLGLIGRYHDVLRRTDVWRFVRRESDIEPMWMSPEMRTALGERTQHGD